MELDTPFRRVPSPVFENKLFGTYLKTAAQLLA
jgi:hypothetical protein